MLPGGFPLAGRPGHAGFTPQPVLGPQLRARFAAALTSTPVWAALALPRPLAAQALARLQAPERESTVATMLRVQRVNETLSARRFPFAFREGIQPGSAPEGPV